MKEVPKAKRLAVAQYYLLGYTYSDIEATKRPLVQALPWSRFSRALSLHWSKTGLGIIFIARVTPRGTKIRSSKYPRTGMKSGIRSIGLRAYPTTQAVNTLAYHGTLGSL